MTDTNVLTFSLRERTWLSTKIFQPNKDYAPGQLLRIVVDPVSALIRQDAPRHGTAAFAAPLCLTISRFRDFKYVGTKVSLVPAATNAQVDPAHISTVAGVSNYMHPRDVDNMMHWRRWVGGDFRIPYVYPTQPSAEEEGEFVYSEQDSYDLDAAWLSDARFNHARVSDGFSMFVRPLRARLETSAMATASIFGYYSTDSMDYEYGSLRTDDKVSHFQPLGATMLSAGDVQPDSWIPNPFAGFFYTYSGLMPGGEHELVVSGYRNRFPWFSDVPDLSSDYSEFAEMTAAKLLGMVRERLLAPICILRLPPAYGSVYYYTLYLRHYFEVRRPFLTSGTYVATRLQRFNVDPVPDQAVAGVRRLVAEKLEDDDEYRVIQMISPDPYGAGDGSDLISMADLKGSIWQMEDGNEDNDLIDDEKEGVEMIDDKYQGAPAPRIVSSASDGDKSE